MNARDFAIRINQLTPAQIAEAIESAALPPEIVEFGARFETLAHQDPIATPRPTPGAPVHEWDALTIVALMDSALNGMAEQFWNGASFRDIPERVQLAILGAVKDEAAERLAVIRKQRRERRNG